MAKHRGAESRNIILAAWLFAAGLALTGPAAAQETVIIGGPGRTAPAVEVDLSVLDSRGPAHLSRKKSSLPDLLPPDAANQPRARAAISRPLTPPAPATHRVTPPSQEVTAAAGAAPSALADKAAATPSAPAATPGLVPIAAPVKQASPVALRAAAPPEPVKIRAAEPAPPPAAQTLATLPAITPAPSPDGGVNTALLFAPGAVDLSADATAQLDTLLELLKSQDRVQLKAHASGAATDTEARRIALKRALAARSHFLANGIDSTRIDVRALGPAADGGSDDRIDVIVVAQ